MDASLRAKSSKPWLRMKRVVGPLSDTFGASGRRKRTLTGTADVAIVAMATVILVTEVRDLIAVCALLGQAAVQSMIPTRPIAARLLPSESAIIASPAWPRAYSLIASLTIRTTTPPEIVIVSVIAIATVTETRAGTASDGIERETATVTVSAIGITTAARVGTTSSITMIVRDGLERRTGKGCIAGEWTETSTNYPMVMRDLAPLVVAELMTTTLIAETLEIQR